MSAVPDNILGRVPVPFGRVSNRKFLPFVDLAPVQMRGVQGIFDVEHWVNTNVRYVLEPGRQDNWQSPETTLRLRTGDCEDIALLKMALLRGLGHAPMLLLCKDLSVFSRRGQINHAVALTKYFLFDLGQREPRRVDRPLPGETLVPGILYKGEDRFLMGRRR